LNKRVKAKERAARALMRLVKPTTIETGFCVSGTITKSCHRPLALLGYAHFDCLLTDITPQPKAPVPALFDPSKVRHALSLLCRLNQPDSTFQHELVVLHEWGNQ
jgi:hypothetical protein